jgi:hypothetical protein
MQPVLTISVSTCRVRHASLQQWQEPFQFPTELGAPFRAESKFVASKPLAAHVILTLSGIRGRWTSGSVAGPVLVALLGI